MYVYIGLVLLCIHRTSITMYTDCTMYYSRYCNQVYALTLLQLLLTADRDSHAQSQPLSDNYIGNPWQHRLVYVETSYPLGQQSSA